LEITGEGHEIYKFPVLNDVNIVRLYGEYDCLFLISDEDVLYLIVTNINNAMGQQKLNFWKVRQSIDKQTKYGNIVIAQTIYNNVLKAETINFNAVAILMREDKLVILDKSKVSHYDDIIDIRHDKRLVLLRIDGSIGIYDSKSTAVNWIEEWGDGFTFEPRLPDMKSARSQTYSSN